MRTSALNRPGDWSVTSNMLRRIWRVLTAILVVLVGAVLLWGAAGLLMNAGPWGAPPRGQMVEVDGRQMRIVCEGTRLPGQPLVVFEAGAYSGAADFGWLQPEVAKFARTCSYDRAGIGWSDTTDGPRNPGALADDLQRLLTAAGETGPYVLVGHSMAGLMTRAFLVSHPDDVKGLVLIDAADPKAIALPGVQVWIDRYRAIARASAAASSFGLIKPLSFAFANRIGLPEGPALREKQRMFGHPRHLRAAATEIAQTTSGRERLEGVDALIAGIPVATVTAGPASPPGENAWQDAQQRAGRISRQGLVINVDGATHTSILGPVYGGQVVDAVRTVLERAALPRDPAPAAR